MNELTPERSIALCEAHCIAKEDEYFKARPQLDLHHNRRIFSKGFSAAWGVLDDKITAMQAEIESLKARVSELGDALSDLSIECFSPLGGTDCPSIDTYNRTFAVLKQIPLPKPPIDAAIKESK